MKGSMRGIWLVAGMFALGGFALAGLFLAPRGKPPPKPATVPGSVPATSLLR